MSTASTSVGLVSGLPYGSIVDGLIAVQRRPITLIDNRLGELTRLRTALLDLSARLLKLKGFGTDLQSSDFFRPAAAASSDETLLTAKASAGAGVGQFRFIVRQLATTHQFTSTRYASANSSFLSPGTLTIENAAGRIDQSTALSALRGGQGVQAGTIHITDRAGGAADVDLRNAQTVEDLLAAINNQTSAAAHAKVQGDRIVLEDTTGLTTGDLTVSDVGSGIAAQQLGLAGGSSTGVLTGEDLVSLSTSYRLGLLNDRLGVRHNAVGPDFRIEVADGTSLDIDLSGRLTDTTALAQLNGGSGVAAGTIHITNRAGVSADIDLSAAQTVGDVVAAINGSGLGGVAAAILNQEIQITDSSTGDGELTISDIDDGVTARDLGIVGTSTAGAVKGTAVFHLDTIGDVLNAINLNVANAGKIAASISADGDSLVVTDLTTGPGEFNILTLNDSKAALDLGLLQSGPSGTITSSRLLAGLDTVFLRTLNGGAGVATGVVRLTDRTGATTDVDLSNALTLADVVSAINDAGTAITAGISPTGLGIVLTDASNGSGPLVIEDVTGSTAAGLKIAYNGNAASVSSGNLQRQYISENTLLDQIDNGRAIPRGRFRITNALGGSAVVDLTQGNEITVRDLLAEINSRGINVEARINDSGDGIVLIDNSGGGGQLTVTEEDAGSTARALRILGKAKVGATTIDGSFEAHITVTGGDTLNTLINKIRASGAAVNASIINDGSPINPYRLTLTSQRSGAIGRLAIDSGTTGLGLTTLVRGRDAVVQVGDGEVDAPFLVTSSSNTVKEVSAGLELELLAAGSKTVTVTVTREIKDITDKLEEFTQGYNAVIDRIEELSDFNSESGQRGVLLGDRTAERIRTRLHGFVTSIVPGLPAGYTRLGSVGFSFANGRLTFDAEKFEQAYESDPTSVESLFTQDKTGLGDALVERIEELVNTTDGTISRREEVLNNKEASLTRRKTELEALLETRRARLLAQFQSAETIIARLQSQQTALGSLSTIANNFRASTSNNSK